MVHLLHCVAVVHAGGLSTAGGARELLQLYWCQIEGVQQGLLVLQGLVVAVSGLDFSLWERAGWSL